MNGWMDSDRGVQPWVRRHPSRLRSPSEVVIGGPAGVQGPSAPEKGSQQNHSTVGALAITYTILGDPYYTYSIMGPKTLF